MDSRSRGCGFCSAVTALDFLRTESSGLNAKHSDLGVMNHQLCKEPEGMARRDPNDGPSLVAVDVYGEDGLPFNTRFGNGDAIGADLVQLINEVYEANTLREPWQAGDLMLVDNVRTAHGRERFEGPREVLVAMADAVHLADCSTTIEVTAS